MKHFSAHIFYIMLLPIILSCHHSVQEFREIAVEDYGFYADSVDYTIREAERVWKSRPWRKEYTNEVFVNHILPPFAAKEPVEFYWRSNLPERLNVEISDTAGITEVAQAINRKIDALTDNRMWGNRQLRYSEIMSGKIGKCDDRSTLAVLAMRAHGIPAAFEYVPNWGDTNNGHSFCSVILPDDSLLVFQERQDDGVHIQYSHKVPKVYRKSFFPDRNTRLAEHIKFGEPVPPEFSDIFFEDVTRFHNIGQCDVTLSVKLPGKRLAYLCVFTPKGWNPVAYGEIQNGEVTFCDVGNGGNYDFRKRGNNLGDGILYLPTIYEDGRIEPIGTPFILSASGKRDINSERSSHTVTLTRKYPRQERAIKFAASMTGGVFEVSNRPDFSDAVTVDLITDIPAGHIQYKEVVSQETTYRYARYRKSKGTFSISELSFFDTEGDRIEGMPFTPNYVEATDVEAIYDGKPLTYFEVSGIADFWIGIEFNKPSKIGSIGFCPRTDDNDISPGDEYELLFWDNEWKSLGRKTAKNFTLTFDDVPNGMLLWLRDLSKGKEERPFTCENGEQIWW